MKMSAKAIAPCLWFDTEAEAAANHYVSIFEDSAHPSERKRQCQ